MASLLRTSAAARRLVALLAALPASTFAQAIWIGAGSDSLWSTGLNWVGATAPLSDPATEILLVGPGGLAPYVDSEFTLRRLTFVNGASTFALSGEALVFAGGLVDDPDGSYLRNSSAVTQTIGNGLVLGSFTRIQADAGDLVLNGDIALSDEYGTVATFTAASGRTISINGSVTSAGFDYADLHLDGGGAFVFAAGLDDSVSAYVRGSGTSLYFADNTTVDSGYYRFEDDTDFTLGSGATIAGGDFGYIGSPDANRVLNLAPGVLNGAYSLSLENITADFATTGTLDGAYYLSLAGNTQLTASATGALNVFILEMLDDSTLTLAADQAAAAGVVALADNSTLRLNGHDFETSAMIALQAPGSTGGIVNGAATDATFTLRLDPDLVPIPSQIDAVLSDGAGGGKLGFTVAGPGVVGVFQAQQYTGATRVTEGATLAFLDCGCDPDAFFVQSTITVDTGGVLAGNARLRDVVVNNGGGLSPGDPVDSYYATDILRAESVTFAGDATYLFQIQDATGDYIDYAWDFLEVNGALDFTNLTSLTVTVGFLDEYFDPGLPLNFDESLPYSWKLASAAGGIVGFDSGKVIVNPDFFGAGLAAFPGQWSVTQVGDDLFVNYAPVPEPAACALLVAAGAALAATRRRRRDARR